jgi:hypothetical protein
LRTDVENIKIMKAVVRIASDIKMFKVYNGENRNKFLNSLKLAMPKNIVKSMV